MPSGRSWSHGRCPPVDVFLPAECTQQVAYNGELSTIQLVPFGVPQGSVLGPLLYVLYTAELFSVVAQHYLRLHMYVESSVRHYASSVVCPFSAHIWI